MQGAALPVYMPNASVQRVDASPLGFKPNQVTVQLKSVIQRRQCGECLQHNSHLPSCSHSKPKKQSPAGKGTHKPGMNHDDGSRFTHGGSGSEKHDHGLHAQAVHRKQKERLKKK
jgi:hypothetical protein